MAGFPSFDWIILPCLFLCAEVSNGLLHLQSSLTNPPCSTFHPLEPRDFSKTQNQLAGSLQFLNSHPPTLSIIYRPFMPWPRPLSPVSTPPTRYFFQQPHSSLINIYKIPISLSFHAQNTLFSPFRLTQLFLTEATLPISPLYWFLTIAHQLAPSLWHYKTFWFVTVYFHASSFKGKTGFQSHTSAPGLCLSQQTHSK